MKGLHPVAAFAIIIMVVMFLYMEFQKQRGEVVTSDTITHSVRAK